MQNRYVGDIGDFGKYGLLRFLCGATDSAAREHLRLGIVWYLVPNEQGTNDGSHTSYLEHDRYLLRLCDVTLYDSLRGLVHRENRLVSSVEESAIFPADTLFYNRPLTYSALSRARKARFNLRQRWLDAAVEFTEPSDIIFLDPDNGLEVRSVTRYSKHGPKYVFLEELEPFVTRKQSLVIYQHLCRRKSAAEQIDERLASLRGLSPETMCSALRYHRGSPRVFFVLASQDPRLLLEKRIQHFVSHTEWGKHFSLFR